MDVFRKRQLYASLMEFAKRHLLPNGQTLPFNLQFLGMLQQRILRRHRNNIAKPFDYVIQIHHRRLGFAAGVNFCSTYYASDEKDAGYMEQIFSNAFHQAHPDWKIEKITVETK